MVVVTTLFEVVSQGRSGLGAKGNRPPSPTFSYNSDCRGFKVEVGHANGGDLRQSGTRVDHDAKRCAVSDIFEFATPTGFEKLPEIFVDDHGHGTIWNTRCPQIDHGGAGNKLSVFEPSEEWLE